MGPEQAKWDHVRALTANVRLSDSADEVSWRLSGSGKFTVKSMYKELCRGRPYGSLGALEGANPAKN